MPETMICRPNAPVATTPRQSSPEQEVIKYISKFIRLNKEDIRAIVENLRIRSYKKGETILKEGQVSDLCYFNLKGCVRQYYLIDGEEKTTNFYTEGQPISPNEGSLKKMPSKFYLSCVENSILTVGSVEDELDFFQKFPKFESVCRVAVEDELGKSHEMMATYMLNNPEERYLNLLKTRPELLDRVPQYQLASYLGVTPESLSRIRKRIMNLNLGRF